MISMATGRMEYPAVGLQQLGIMRLLTCATVTELLHTYS